MPLHSNHFCGLGPLRIRTFATPCANASVLLRLLCFMTSKSCVATQLRDHSTTPVWHCTTASQQCRSTANPRPILTAPLLQSPSFLHHDMKCDSMYNTKKFFASQISAPVWKITIRESYSTRTTSCWKLYCSTISSLNGLCTWLSSSRELVTVLQEAFLPPEKYDATPTRHNRATPPRNGTMSLTR